jgi:putative ABC transport system permease protein
MTRDIRLALRMIASHRWFSTAVVAILALGIGLNTMVFTLVNAALFKPVAVPGGKRLVAIASSSISEGNRGMGVSYPDFLEYRAAASSLEALEAASGEGAVLSDPGIPPQLYSMNRVSPGMFDMIHMRPILGRGFLPGDDKPGGEPVVLLGYGVWKDRYNSSPEVIGRQARVNGNPATIIGVMPAGFKFPDNQDLWMPLTPSAELQDRTHRSLQLFGLLEPGATIKQAAANLDSIASRLAADYPEADRGVGVLVDTFNERFNGGSIKQIFLLMLAAVAFVLLIVCSNVSNMMLSRALDRQREISIRAALGASRWQVIRQLLIESMMLSALGGVLGFGLCRLGVHWFDLATQDVGKPYWVEFSMDYVVFGYFAAVSLASGLLFGLAPALRASRFDLNRSLKDGTRSVGTGRGGKLSTVLVVCQLALTLVLLTGAGIFVRSFLENLSLNPSVPADHLLTAGINLPKERYPDAASRQRFFDQLLPRIGALADVTHVAMASNLPGIWAGTRRVEIEDARLEDPARGPSAAVLVQSPGYFGAIDLPILLGRDFTDTDGAAGSRSAVVSKEFAEKHWPGQEAIGKRFRFYEKEKPGDWLSVTGVSANIVQQPQEAAPNPLVYVPYRQEGQEFMFLLARTTGSPTSVVPSLRATVQNLDQDLPLFEVRTLAEAVEHNIWFLRLFGTLFLAFALIALVIASVGFYAVMAQATSTRTREIGVRMALGATSRNILGLVFTRGAKQLIAGLVLGLAVAFPAARLLTNLPLRVSPSDPVLFIIVSLALIGVGLFACWLPAHRAARLHPVEAIRYE